MEPVKMKLSELVTIGCIIVSITTAYVLLSTDVTKIKDAIVRLEGTVTNLENIVDQVQSEQFRIRFMMDRHGHWNLSSDEADDMLKELNKKPWRR